MLVRISRWFLGSFFSAVIIFLISLSFVTGQFPPDLAQLKSMIRGVQQLREVAEKIQRANPQGQVLSVEQGSLEGDVAQLEALNKVRNQVGEAMFKARGLASDFGAEKNDLAEIQNLKKKVGELEVMVFRLQGRLDEMEVRLNQ